MRRVLQAGVLAAASVVLPARPARPETVLVVPAAARAGGAAGTVWTTELALFNPSAASSATVTIAFLPRAGSAPAEGSVVVGPRRSVTIPDVVGALGAAGGGALRLSAAAPFLASSRTFNGGSPACGTFGVGVPAAPLASAVTRGVLHGLSGGRVNAGFVNDAETAVTAAVRLRDGSTGALLGAGSVEVPAHGSAQVDDLRGTLAPAAPVTATFLLEVEAPSPVLAWATPIDGTSGDATFQLAEADAGAPVAGWWESWFTLPADAGLAFRVEEGLRFSGNGNVPRVVPLPDGRVRLYTPSLSGLLSATSTDGFTFVPDPGTRGSMSDCAVIYLASGGFRFLWPAGPTGSQVLRSATSPDGLTFAAEAGDRFVPAPGDAGIVQVPHAVRLADGRWRLSYVADWFGTGGAGPRNNTRTAISSDEGLTWTVENPSATGADSVDPDVVKVEDGTYRLYYKNHDAFRVATSTDGASYPASGGAGLQVLEASSRFDPAVIRLRDGTIRLYFGTTGGVGSAVATDTAR